MSAVRLTVAELNALASEILGQAPLADCELLGEVSAATLAASGHFYFTLKDASASVSCVMFRQDFSRLAKRPQVGDQVILRGRAGLYQRDGRFQFYAQDLRLGGQGNLWQQFEALKAELEAKGYFAPDHKQALPSLPHTIGIVTSSKGAAVHDIINVSQRRFPGIKLQLIPVAVQGPGASQEIARAIKIFNHLGQADLLIVGRGGGSQEDLWAFNERLVADAIYQSTIPIISAVGHETDFSISDFVADLRAPTPSAAAELAVPVKADLVQGLQTLQQSLKRAMVQQVVSHKQLGQAFNRRLYRAWTSRLAEASQRLDTLMRHPLLQSPLQTLKLRRQELASLEKDLLNLQAQGSDRRHRQLADLSGKLELLNPYNILQRGYTAVLDGEGRILSRVSQVQEASQVHIRFIDGQAIADIREISCDNKGSSLSNTEGH
ncbi:MAG: exodeoxyribonuclease VII large subunit [Eubacteriales bacterium]|nr:exodeoxyribonuclease VII large subunit [Clostridiales bacterium]MDY5836856.1 exodeoxyribonuclease VII large subunit [Eubacteriales bacterium]